MAESPHQDPAIASKPGEEPNQQAPAKPAPGSPTGGTPEIIPDESQASAAGNSDQLRPGKLFASFELERELESGSTGVVWLAHDYSVGRQVNQVALRFLPDSIVGATTAVEELKNEIRLRAALKHPNILRIFGLVEKKGRVAIQTEYPDGQSLSSLRMAKPNQIFEVRDLEKWVNELCDALMYAHEVCELIDGGIVPANLVVDARGNLRLKEFGLATCIAGSMNRLRLIQDTGDILPYQSPQRAAGEPPAITDDLYSLGAILYELLTGKPPFSSEDIAAEVAGKNAISMTELRTELGIKGEPIPSHWEETVAASLAKDPAQRPQSAAEVRKRLKLSTPGADNPVPSVVESVPHRNLKPRPPVRTPAARTPWLLIAGILLLLAFGSAVAFFSFHHRSEPGKMVWSAIAPAKKPSSTPPAPSPINSPGKEGFQSVTTPSPKISATPFAEASATPSAVTSATPASGASSAPSAQASPNSSPEAGITPTLPVSPVPTPEVSPTPSAQAAATPAERLPAGPSLMPPSPNETDATREEVIKRINALPGVSAAKKANMIEKMRKARSMERIAVIPFEAGQTALRRAAADELAKSFDRPEMRDKLSDPTAVLVVAGYADTGGRADKNLRISQERAENISKILKEQVKLLNAMQTIGMGGTELLDSKLPGQNRAVEVWVVVPL